MDASTTTSTFDITANESNAQYQWVDCDNNFAPIVGETGQTFTATANGNYAVIVTSSNGCEETSPCVAITTISVEENALEAGLTVSPNPTDGAFTITASNYSGEVTIEVMDVSGKIIFRSTQHIAPNAAADINLQDAANGVYIVNVSDLNETHSIRVVKK